MQKEIDYTRLTASLNIKIGEHGKLKFDKSIFNSPQEKELYIVAKSVLTNSIILPNSALRQL